MNKNMHKIARRKFRSKLKKVFKNTLDSGTNHDKKKNLKQVIKLRYLKHDSDVNYSLNAEAKDVIYAPVCIDYYNEVNFNKTNNFILKVKRAVLNKKKRVSINFDNTKQITASAMISFLAEVDTLLSTSTLGKNCITFTHPKSDKVESVLKQIGFYDLLKKNKRETKDYDDVAYWNYASGVNSDTEHASGAMREIEVKISHRAQRKLIKGFIEAMANCVEHAYHDMPDAKQEMTKWWAFAGVKENKLVVVICDKGIGIPCSLPLTRAEGVIEKFKNALQLKRLNDSAMIKIASRMGRTRTQQGNRGKGLKDIRSIIDTMNEGHLTIYSNKGYYRYFRNNSKLDDYMKEQKTSVCGTIIEWAIPLDASVHEVINEQSN
ncbi:hypothetical protein SAMN05518863_103159 [Candidatus Pantoea symbiotica]|uniref:ATP-binding protein n=1 Tax=Candidatus Pantoea symbiotica TaxID=1884370 RepID=A0A1I3UU14_9GAMM|nr:MULTISPECIES: hypothetical protein [Pantoea]SFJ86834.1 hypothetical protein SAMN05518863_103159 [Pantoea symbiotica]SFU61231.1 hypothetical protein SAMN05518864_103159 [Pantoea sp. YR525]